ncbi:MAG: hypothetical protein CAF45_016630 [Nitrospira sp. CG24E]|nr:MAG: hypothetical protein CAF45_016630 [Nitrospira sp. CG24E]
MVLQVESRAPCVGADRTTPRPSAQRKSDASLEELGDWRPSFWRLSLSALRELRWLGKSVTRKLPHLVVLLFSITLCAQAFSVWAGENRHIVTVPALAVLSGGQTGIVHYIVLQIDKDSRQGGPTVQFNEINLGGGSIVSEDWKEGVRQAVAAATKAVGEDGREWVITIKNRSYNALTEGASASSAVAVGLVAAWRGDDVKSDIALTGQIMPDGRIESVGALAVKIEAAARAEFRTVLVPRRQLSTVERDLPQLVSKWNIKAIEVATLEEAYQLMTTARR